MIKLSEYLEQEYGEKIYKLPLSSGCTCPNRDGKISYGGCSFCSEGGSGDFASPLAPIDEQIEFAKSKIKDKTRAERFIAYFQSYTNTYGDVNRLTKLYEETINRDDIAILSIGTRPDCLGDDIMDMLIHLNSIKPVWIELGLQTIHDETARDFNRGYDLKTFQDAYEKLTSAGLTVIVHIIFGLPGESRKDMLATVKYLAGLNPPLPGIKIQMLHILKGTKMGEEFEMKPFPIMSLEEYADLVAEGISLLNEKTVIHRMTGDGPGWLLIEPNWSRNKRKVMNAIIQRLD